MFSTKEFSKLLHPSATVFFFFSINCIEDKLLKNDVILAFNFAEMMILRAYELATSLCQTIDPCITAIGLNWKNAKRSSPLIARYTLTYKIHF